MVNLDMELFEAIRLRILELIKIHDTNGNEVSLKSGIDCSTLNKFLKGTHKSIKIETITLICQTFNITLEDFFRSPLFNDIEVKD